MNDPAEVRAAIHAHVHSMVAAMQAESGREPWLSLPLGYSLDSIPDLIRALADEALGPPDPEAHARKVWIAAEHGVHRVDSGFPEVLIFSEYHLLRTAVWAFLSDRYPPAEAFGAIARIDAAISQATSASLLGYHRQALDKRGEWPAAVERLIERWTTL